MNRFELTFNGTGAAVYLCIGQIPDVVEVLSVGDSEAAIMHWSKRGMPSVAAISDGYMLHTDQVVTLYTVGTGIQPYEGGELLSAVEQTNVDYGGGIYLKPDVDDYRKSKYYGYAADPIDTWTFVSGQSGHFNSDILGTGTRRIGPGSIIRIKETATGISKETCIVTLAADAGAATTEVALARAIGSGKIEFIGGMYDMIPIPIGEVTPKGIKLNIAGADINVDDEIQLLTALTND